MSAQLPEEVEKALTDFGSACYCEAEGTQHAVDVAASCEVALRTAISTALDAEREKGAKYEADLRHITTRMWGSDAPDHPDVTKAFDTLSDRAYSTDRAWDHIRKMCESAARKAATVIPIFQAKLRR